LAIYLAVSTGIRIATDVDKLTKLKCLHHALH